MWDEQPVWYSQMAQRASAELLETASQQMWTKSKLGVGTLHLLFTSQQPLSKRHIRASCFQGTREWRILEEEPKHPLKDVLQLKHSKMQAVWVLSH